MNLEVFDLFGEDIFCSICLETIKEGQRTVVLHPCQHGFHQICIDPWLFSNTTCPNCRGSVQSPEQENHSQPTANQLLDLERIRVSYVLLDWILHTYPNAQQYTPRIQAIRQFIRDIQWNGRRPVPLDTGSRSFLLRMKSYINSRERMLFHQVYPNQHHTVIHRCPQVQEIRAALLPRFQQFVAEHG